METPILVMWAEGHASGRKEIKPFTEVMKDHNLTAEKLNELINSGDMYEGKFFDIALTIK